MNNQSIRPDQAGKNQSNSFGAALPKASGFPVPAAKPLNQPAAGQAGPAADSFSRSGTGLYPEGAPSATLPASGAGAGRGFTSFAAGIGPQAGTTPAVGRFESQPGGYVGAASSGIAGKQPLVTLTNVFKIYGKDETEVRALNNVSAQIYQGQFTAIVGPSGSGKSTLLHCLAGLDSVTAGSVNVAGKNLHQMNDTDLTKFRREYIGFIFQAFNLVPTLNAVENITLPLRLANKKVSKTELAEVVRILGLQDRLTHKPAELSGGQQQRVAVARALITKPALLVADEPTGNLDSKSSAEVLRLLREAVDQLKQTVVMVTHDHRAAALADRVLVIRDGQVAADLLAPGEEQISALI